MDIIDKLKFEERNAVAEGLAMMTYIPSIGRALESGGVDKFIRIMSEEIKQLENIISQEEFDSFHDSIVKLIKKEIKAKDGKTLSHGQAQKPLNVFLKVYVDWASLPSLDKSCQIRKFLHVPLDSILMREIKNNFPDDYKRYVEANYALIRESHRKSRFYEEFGESGLLILIRPSDFSLSKLIFKEMYYAWQHCLRAIYPEKPVLLDVLWSTRRKYKEPKKKSEN